GSVVGQAVVILTYPLITRLYDPADFGLFSVFASVVSMVAVASTASLEAAVPLPREDRDAAAVAWAALAFVAATGLATALVGVVAAERPPAPLGEPRPAGRWTLAGL